MTDVLSIYRILFEKKNFGSKTILKLEQRKKFCKPLFKIENITLELLS